MHSVISAFTFSLVALFLLIAVICQLVRSHPTIVVNGDFITNAKVALLFSWMPILRGRVTLELLSLTALHDDGRSRQLKRL